MKPLAYLVASGIGIVEGKLFFFIWVENTFFFILPLRELCLAQSSEGLRLSTVQELDVA